MASHAGGDSAATLKGTSLDRSTPRANELRVGIVHTQWNTEVVGALLAGAKAELLRQGVLEANIHVIAVRASGGVWRHRRG